MPDEVENLQEQVNLLAETLQKTLDFEKILAIAEGAEELSGKMPEVLRKVTESEAAAKVRACRSRFFAVCKRMKHFCFLFIGIIWSFLASLWSQNRIFFRRFSDAEPPKNTDGFLFCGGYPELHAEELSENQTMRTKIRDNIRQGNAGSCRMRRLYVPVRIHGGYGWKCVSYGTGCSGKCLPDKKAGKIRLYHPHAKHEGYLSERRKSGARP